VTVPTTTPVDPVFGGADPVLPAYEGASLASVVPALMAAPGHRPAWVPAPAAGAAQVVLLVIDGLGWRQLLDRVALAPTLANMTGGAITSVVPTTTATALTSISFGAPPASHGMVGYRVKVEGPSGDEVLNALHWTTTSGDARKFVPPTTFLRGQAFGGRPVPVVSRSFFVGTGFTIAHLGGAEQAFWHVPSSIAVETGRLLRAGHPFVYAYYDGVDKIAHAAGLDAHYDAELTAADRLVADIAAQLPPGAALVVTADHGQVEVGENVHMIEGPVLEASAMMSGEGRFRWLHAKPGAAGDLLAAATETYGAEAWVHTVDELEADGWYGGPLDQTLRGRLGDVAVVPHAPVAYLDPADRNEHLLICRHGSLTADEMLVPLVATGGG
jgi:Type I phosphodiesterase / nucleotide pyrophosphatase